MNLKQLYLLTGILTIAAIITYFIKNADASLPPDKRIGEPIVSNEAFQGVNRIVIHGDDGTFTLTREAAGEKWRMEERYGLPVSNATLGRVATSLAEETLERLVSANPDRIAELGFGARGIAFHKSEGEPAVHVQLGKTSDTGKQLVKYAGEDKAFLASGQVNLDADPIAWLDKTLVTFERDAIRSVEITFPDGSSLAVSRDGTDVDWTARGDLPENKELDQDAITRAATRFANLTFTGLTGTDDAEFTEAMDNAQRYVLTLEDGTSYTFEIGRRPEVKITKEVEATDAEGNPTTETEEEVETPAGPVFVRIQSSDPKARINEYMQTAAFEVGSYHYTSLPQSLDALLQDAPEQAPEQEQAAASETESAPKQAPASETPPATGPAEQ